MLKLSAVDKNGEISLESKIDGNNLTLLCDEFISIYANTVLGLIEKFDIPEDKQMQLLEAIQDQAFAYTMVLMGKDQDPVAQAPMFLSPEDPDYLEAQDFCAQIVQAQEGADETDYDIAKMLRRLGIQNVHAADIADIKSGAKVPSQTLARVILHILEHSYIIHIPLQWPDND